MSDFDAELARRIEWATGYNGEKVLGQLRSEGLDLIARTPEPGRSVIRCRHSVNESHEHGPCSTCGAPRWYMDMGFFNHCDDGSAAQAFCGRAAPKRSFWGQWR